MYSSQTCLHCMFHLILHVCGCCDIRFSFAFSCHKTRWQQWWQLSRSLAERHWQNVRRTHTTTSVPHKHICIYIHILIYLFSFGAVSMKKCNKWSAVIFWQKNDKWQKISFLSFFFFCMWNAWVCVSNNSIASWRTGHTNLALTWELRLENVWASHFS